MTDSAAEIISQLRRRAFGCEEDSVDPNICSDTEFGAESISTLAKKSSGSFFEDEAAYFSERETAEDIPEQPFVPTATSTRKSTGSRSAGRGDKRSPSKREQNVERRVRSTGGSVRVGVMCIILSFIGGFAFHFFAAANENLNGHWRVSTTFDGVTRVALMDLKSNFGSISGSGVELLNSGQTALFTVTGQIQGRTITFDKFYEHRELLAANHSASPPITFVGQLASNGSAGQITMQGTWKLTQRDGNLLRPLHRDYRGSFSAESLSPAASDAAYRSFPSAYKPAHSAATSSSICGTQLALIGLLLVVIAGTLIYISFKLFGPTGQMTVWDKRKYVPSQYKSQHAKALREFIQPLRAGSLPLGQRMEWASWKTWEPKDLSIPPEMRASNPNMLILGAANKGKTKLVATMVAHDIESNDRAVVVVDSDGALIDEIKDWLSKHPDSEKLTRRVTIIDPTGKADVVGYNPLELPFDGDLQNAASGVVQAFKAIYMEVPGSQSQWNAQTANILRNSVLLLMANNKTLADLPTLLSDNDFRDIMLETIEKLPQRRAEYITLLDTWGQYKRLARTDQWITWVEPILNRISPMLGDGRIRSILTVKQSDINLRELIELKHILLVRVPEGQLDQNGSLLGSLLVGGVKAAASQLSRATNQKQNPTAVYLDEFNSFIDSEMIESINRENERLKLGVILTAGTLQRLPETFRNNLLINVGMIACFALSKKDAELLAPMMFRVDGRKLKHQTLSNFFNPINSKLDFMYIADEEKFNGDRLVGQEVQSFLCYRVGTIASVFHLKSHPFPKP